MRLSIIIPVYNEEKNITALYQRLIAVLGERGDDHGHKGQVTDRGQGQDATEQTYLELLFVNDGSTDGSLGLIRQLAETDSRIRVLDLSRNFGHQVAVTAGIDHCTGDRAVIIDADLQDPPELIPELLGRMDWGYDVVYARRRDRKGEGFLKKTTAKLFYRTLARMTHVPIPLDTGDFRVISRRVMEVLKQMPEREKFIRGQIAWMGFDQTFIEYDRDERMAGDSGYSWRRMLHFALDGITSFSNVPLKMATISGFVVSFISFILMLYALYSRFISKDYVPGWTSLILSVLFIGGIQLIAIGIIGEYIGRISNNVKDRPLYLIKEDSDTK